MESSTESIEIDSDILTDDSEVLRPIQSFFDAIDYHRTSQGIESVKSGLALCHGHNHSNSLFLRFPDVNFWYLVDANKDVYPDYVADMEDSDQMAYLPDRSFDYIVSAYCPIRSDTDTLANLLILMRRLIRGEGFVYLPSLFKKFYSVISEKERGAFNRKILAIIGRPSLEEYREYYNRDYDEDDDEKAVGDDIYRQVVVGNYARSHYPKGREVDQLVATEGKRVMSLFVEKYHFRVDEKHNKDNFICLRPIKRPASTIMIDLTCHLCPLKAEYRHNTTEQFLCATCCVGK